MAPRTTPRKLAIFERIRLVWWAILIVPIALLAWLGLTGKAPMVVAMMALFALVFWLLSLIVALIMLMLGRGRGSV